MKIVKKIFSSAIALVAFSAIISCSSNLDEPNKNDPNENHFVKVNFNVTKTGFDDESTRSATQWENGDTIYMLFTSGSNLVYGDAVYTDGEWFVNYNGDLTRNTATNVQAYYFENKVSEANATLILNENTAIYEDLSGTYTITDGSLSITANLSPKTGRLRFKGENSEEIKVYGITHNTTFNRYTGEYTTSKGILKAKVSSEYTPYIYGEFTDSEEPRLNIWQVSSGFTRIFSTDIYKKAESGYITIPTSSAHNGWQNNVTFKVNDVEFTMIPVEYSFGNFLMAQTETTEALYEEVMNDGYVSQLPKIGINEEGWTTFLSTLCNLTELYFRLPSTYEWMFAFQGGNKSQGFTYSGSNDLNEVAWYEDNSNNNRHEVGLKQPNELGFYDMSGNVSERATRYDGEWYGGNFSSRPSYCEGSYSYYIGYSASNCGIRFVMSN